MSNKDLLGLKGLFRGVTYIRYRRDVIKPLLFSIGLAIWLMLLKTSAILALEKICGILLTLTSTLLSFSLAGYALLVGFGMLDSAKLKLVRPDCIKSNNKSELSSSTTNQRKVEPRKIQLFEKVSIVFSFYLIVQVFALTLSTIINILIIKPFALPEPYPDIINFIGVLLCLFVLFYQLFLLKDLIIIIYNYSLYRKHLSERE